MLGSWGVLVINEASIYNHLNDVQLQNCNYKFTMLVLLIYDDNLLEICVESENYHYNNVL
jgi:hypothetical protein